MTTHLVVHRFDLEIDGLFENDAGLRLVDEFA